MKSGTKRTDFHRTGMCRATAGAGEGLRDRARAVCRNHPEELKRLEAEANQHAEIQEFVPLTQIDPIYFEKTYHVGPAKGNEKVYRLLARAMCQQARGAIAKLMMRGKEKLVLIRPHRQRPFIA
jgi:non-homologous end joining protein Ku